MARTVFSNGIPRMISSEMWILVVFSENSGLVAAEGEAALIFSVRYSEEPVGGPNMDEGVPLEADSPKGSKVKI